MSSEEESPQTQSRMGSSNIQKRPASRDSSLKLSRPDRSSNNMHKAKQTILQAVEALESENEELHQLNEQLQVEMNQLRAENQKLRQELESLKGSYEKATDKINGLVRDNRDLTEELGNHMNMRKHFEEEQEKMDNMKITLKQENLKFKTEADNLRIDLGSLENQLRTAHKELDTLKKKLDQASRKNFHDGDIESRHELEMLKDEKNEILRDNNELQKINKKLSNEISNLQTSLEEKTSDLRNANRRHNLLTKEFNSLLDENNRLKLQLRRRIHPPSMSAAQSQDVASEETTTFQISSQSGIHNYNCKTSSSDLSLQLPREHGNRREASSVSRDKPKFRREKSSTRRDSTASVTLPDAYKKRSSGNKSDDSGSNPDSLPSISISGGKSARKWKP